MKVRLFLVSFLQQEPYSAKAAIMTSRYQGGLEIWDIN